MRLTLTVPADNARGPLYFEQAPASVHQSNPGRLPLALALEPHGRAVRLTVDCPPELLAAVRAAVYAAYPDAQLTAVTERPSTANEMAHWSIDLDLTDDLLP